MARITALRLQVAILVLFAGTACAVGIEVGGPSESPTTATPSTAAAKDRSPKQKGAAVRFTGPRGCGLIIVSAWNDELDTSSIWAVTPDGRSKEILVTENVSDARWSPDGRHIGFTRGTRSGRDWLHVVEPDGSRETRIATLPEDAAWAWAPGGRRVAAAINSWGTIGPIHVISLRGRDRVVAVGTDPAWSPDGSQIAFSTGRLGRGGGALFLVDVRTRATQQLTYPDDASDALPVWSPDGRTILFLRYPADQDGQDGPFADLWSLDVATRSVTRITDRQDDLNGVWGPTWSPTGDLITYSPEADDYMETEVSRPDGSRNKDIWTHHFYSRSPDWSPSGEEIVFEAYVGIRVASAATTRSRRLLRNGELSWHSPDWAPC